MSATLTWKTIIFFFPARRICFMPCCSYRFHLFFFQTKSIYKYIMYSYASVNFNNRKKNQPIHCSIIFRECNISLKIYLFFCILNVCGSFLINIAISKLYIFCVYIKYIKKKITFCVCVVYQPYLTHYNFIFNCPTK